MKEYLKHFRWYENGTLEMAVIYSADSESKTAIWFDKKGNKVREENGT